MILRTKIEIRRRTSTRYVSARIAEVVADVTGSVPEVTAAQLNRGGRATITVDLDDAVAVAAVKQIMQRLDGDENAYARDVLNRIDVHAFDTALRAFGYEDYRLCREAREETR